MPTPSDYVKSVKKDDTGENTDSLNDSEDRRIEVKTSGVIQAP